MYMVRFLKKLESDLLGPCLLWKMERQGHGYVKKEKNYKQFVECP